MFMSTTFFELLKQSICQEQLFYFKNIQSVDVD